MSEKQKSYDKSITAKEMYNRTTLVSHEKLKENSHKDNLLAMPLFELFEDFCVEVAEFKKAFRIYERDKTVKNKNNLDREMGDVNNFGSAILAKTDGFNHLIRE